MVLVNSKRSTTESRSLASRDRMATIVTSAMSPSPQTLSRQSIVPLVIALGYLVVLILPWALTCAIDRDPSRYLLKSSSSGQETNYLADSSLLTFIQVSNTLAAIISLPVLSSLLSRAAVVFTQQSWSKKATAADLTHKKRLTVRKLFAVADRGWWNPSLVLSTFTSSSLLFWGFVLLFEALLLPVVRTAVLLPHSVFIAPPADLTTQDLGYVGRSPSPALLQTVAWSPLVFDVRNSLILTTGGVDEKLWPYCNSASRSRCEESYDPYSIGQSSLSQYWESDNIRPGYSTGKSPNDLANAKPGSWH